MDARLRWAVTRRQRRLCQRSGHRWGGWWCYFASDLMIDASGQFPPETRRESWQTRSCRRCRETQYRRVSFDGSEAV